MSDFKIQENYSLLPLTTFGIGGDARYYVEIQTQKDLETACSFVKDKNIPIFILGGGSNVLVSDTGFNGLVIHINIKGFEVIYEEENEVRVKIAAGEDWDKTVERIVKKGWWGVENLSHIPGRVGAFVIQNVGAYGQEASNVVKEVEVYDLEKKEFKIIGSDACKFGYRKSIFNQEDRGKYVIVSVTLRLHKNGKPNLSYPDLQKYCKEKGNKNFSLAEIRDAIIEIRDRKLPKPEKEGNAGSFFKNLIVTNTDFEILLQNIHRNFSKDIEEKIKSFGERFRSNEGIKIPTGFFIDICGLKGIRERGVKLSEKAPLVIINKTGKGKADDVLKLAKKVQDIVYEKTGMNIELETELIGIENIKNL